MICPHCKSEEQVRSNGIYKEKRRYKCLTCKHSFYNSKQKEVKCICGMPFIDGECEWCNQPIFQYHKVDREANLYV